MPHPADSPEFWSSKAGVPLFMENPHHDGDVAELMEFVGGGGCPPGLIFFQTSGSEGVPKWVGLSREACLASARAVNDHLEASRRDRWLLALPTYHVGGFSIVVRAREAGCAYRTLRGRWQASAFAETCAAEGITLTSLVPTQVYDLVQQRIEAPAGLRAIVVGGGGMTREMGMRALELGWPVLQSYGMTETASQVATEPLDHLRAGFDPDSLEVLPCWDVHTTEDSHLVVRGAPLASGYAVKQKGAWQWQAIDGTSGLVTRDRVQIWQHGTRRFLRFLGRESAFVKVMGELVNLPALQQRLDALLLDLGRVPQSDRKSVV